MEDLRCTQAHAGRPSASCGERVLKNSDRSSIRDRELRMAVVTSLLILIYKRAPAHPYTRTESEACWLAGWPPQRAKPLERTSHLRLQRPRGDSAAAKTRFICTSAYFGDEGLPRVRSTRGNPSLHPSCRWAQRHGLPVEADPRRSSRTVTTLLDTWAQHPSCACAPAWPHVVSL
jgi:hypothetical protein